MCTSTHPRVNLDVGAVHDHGARCIHNRRPLVVHIVGGHQGALLVAQDALEVGLGGLLKQLVELLHSGGSLDLEHHISDAGVEQGDTDGVTVQLALELREDQGDGSGRTYVDKG